MLLTGISYFFQKERPGGAFDLYPMTAPSLAVSYSLTTAACVVWHSCPGPSSSVSSRRQPPSFFWTLALRQQWSLNRKSVLSERLLTLQVSVFSLIPKWMVLLELNCADRLLELNVLAPNVACPAPCAANGWVLSSRWSSGSTSGRSSVSSVWCFRSLR